jgi:hypothetical protein
MCNRNILVAISLLTAACSNVSWALAGEVSTSHDKAYSLTPYKQYFAGSTGEGARTCTILMTGKDADIINAVNSLVIKNVSARVGYSNPVKFSSVYDDLQDVWNHTHGYTIVSKTQSPGCETYIDFGANIIELANAMSNANSEYIIKEYDSLPALVAYFGFESAEQYELADQMGVSSHGLSEFSKLGINDLRSFKRAMAEMNSSGYAKSEDIDTLLTYLSDKKIGAPRKLTAQQVRGERDKKTADDAAAVQRAFDNCLRSSGYYQTKNNAAKTMLYKKCNR